MWRGGVRVGLAKVGLLAALLLACVVSGQGLAQTVQADVDAINRAIREAGAHWTAGITSVARLSAAERRLRCGTILRKAPPDQLLEIPVGAVPPAFDWRQWNGENWSTPIRDQDGCGSCWDFSAIGVFEALLNIGAGNPAFDQDLSEQYILSCCSSCGDCAYGGWPSRALEFCRTTGTVTETCLPYSADDSVPCGNACSSETPQQIGEWRFLSADIDQIKQAIYTYGPVCACFVVYTDFFYYTSGVYEHVWGDVEGGHAIVIVGWDDATQAWICKNSWGTNWGETVGGQPYTPGAGDGGWFRIRWGNCNIESSETVVATLTSFPQGQVTVTVLDQSGLGIEGVDVYVDCGAWYGVTGPAGTATFDLPAGYDYDVVACSGTEHLLLYGTVTSPGALTLDCGTASLIAVTARNVNGSPLEANLVFECSCSTTLSPLWTTGGTGSFWVTPGIYDFHVWRWPWSGGEGYNLAMLAVDLRASGPLLIDASAMRTARVSLATLLDFSAFWHTAWCCNFCWAPIFDLTQGDAIYTEGSWNIWGCLRRDTSPTVTWRYDSDQSGWLTAGFEYQISAGGTLTLGTASEKGSYTQGETALILTTLTDSYENAIYQVIEINSAGTSPVSSPQRGPTARQDDRPPGESSTWYSPWLTVTPPTPPAIFDGTTCLGCEQGVALAPDTEAGTYALHATQVTHQGTLVADSSFAVYLPTPDPYEPNDTCEAACSIGTVPPTFTSETAHAVDPNEDWFSFQVMGSGLLVVETTCIGADADTVIWLYDACGGALLATDDDSGPGLGSRVECAVGPGTYKLLIDQFEDEYGYETEYSFTVELRPIPDIAATGADPIVLQVLEGTIKDFAGLLSVSNEGGQGSALDFRIVEQDVTPPTTPAPGTTGGAGKKPPIVPTTPGKPLPPKVSEPGPDWTLLLVDPDEPAVGPGDIALVYAQIHDGVLYFRVVSHEPWDENYTELVTYVWLDIDQDLSTGFTSAFGYYMNEIGADYCIYIAYGSGGLWKWASAEWNYLDEPAYLSLSPNSNEFTVGVQIGDLHLPSLLPGVSPGLDLICLNWGADNADWTPDEGLGHVTYPPSVGYLSCVPAEGVVSAGGTSAVTLRVDARGLSAGATCQVRLYFMSNDPDELPTRDVVINVIGGTPAVFTVDPSGVVRSDGQFYGSQYLTGFADVAEWVPVSEPVEPGDVLELDPAHPGQYRKSSGVCSALVAGVVSESPGITLGGDLPAEGHALLALVGIVPVKVTGEGGAIQPGDLVVVSSRAGFGMRWDPTHAGSACGIVGKALEAHEKGDGVILVLLTAH